MENTGTAAPERMTTEGILDCQVCYDYFSTKVYQCVNGHVICKNCYVRLVPTKQCPTCKCDYPLEFVRNRAIERIANQAVVLGLVDNPAAGIATAPTTDPTPGQGVRRRRAPGDPIRREILPVRHNGIICNGNCVRKTAIRGIRYTCAECPDLDFCEECAKDGIHCHHLLIRMADPGSSGRVERAVTNWRKRLNGGETSTTTDNGDADDQRDSENDDGDDEGTVHTQPQVVDIPTPEPSFFPRYTYEPNSGNSSSNSDGNTNSSSASLEFRAPNNPDSARTIRSNPVQSGSIRFPDRESSLTHETSTTGNADNLGLTLLAADDTVDMDQGDEDGADETVDSDVLEGNGPGTGIADISTANSTTPGQPLDNQNPQGTARSWFSRFGLFRNSNVATPQLANQPTGPSNQTTGTINQQT